jgi:type I restriction enzyme M protein
MTTTCRLAAISKPKCDIAQLNAELKSTVAKIDQLRNIDAIVAEIEGGELEA